MLRLLPAFRFSTYYPPTMSLASSSSTFYVITLNTKADKLHKNLRKELLPLPNFDELSSKPFGKIHTDHIISIDWDK